MRLAENGSDREDQEVAKPAGREPLDDLPSSGRRGLSWPLGTAPAGTMDAAATLVERCTAIPAPEPAADIPPWASCQRPLPSACCDNKNPMVSAGCVSNLCPSAGSTTQGCALRVQKCAVGRSQEVSSRVPACTRRNAIGEGCPGFDPLQMIVAHSGQIHRIAVRPLSVMRWIGRGSPAKRRKASSATMNDNENALPKRRWQLVQWQV